MKKAFVCCLFLALLLLGAWWLMSARHDSVRVADVQKAETITLKTTPGGGPVHGIWIRGTGRIDGEADISLLLGGEPYKVEKLRGAIDFQWGGDWYSDVAEIRYEPSEVRSGQLTLRYQFAN